MEVSCENCDQRLRVPDGLRAARIRCRACGHEFEVSSASNQPEQSLAAAEQPDIAVDREEENQQLREFLERTAAERSAANKSGTGTKAGWSAIAFILLLLVTKGPKLWKLFQVRKPAKPAPAQRFEPREQRPLQKQPGN